MSTTNLTVDEDGFAFAANDALTARTDETASTGSLTQSGTAVVNFGNDVPHDLIGRRLCWWIRRRWTASCIRMTARA